MFFYKKKTTPLGILEGWRHNGQNNGKKAKHFKLELIINRASHSGFYTKHYDGFGVFGNGEHNGQNNGKKAKHFKFELIIKGFKPVTVDFVQKKACSKIRSFGKTEHKG